MYYRDFWAVEKWRALEYKECHFFNEEETSFWAVNLEIGEMTVYKTTINGSAVEKQPITRWIPVKEWNRLLKKEGVVIF